jgi:hypothetical protein
MRDDADKSPSMRGLLEHIHPRNERSQVAKQVEESQVGIFWLLDGRLIVDGVPVSLAEPYGQFRNYPDGHDERWRTYQRLKVVPLDVEYDQPPRGRVVYDAVAHQFLLYADVCILRNEASMDQIRRELRLPRDTKISPDAHYRCRDCPSGTE